MTLKKIGKIFVDTTQIAAITDFDTDITDKYKATIILCGGVALKSENITRHEVVHILEADLGIRLIDYKTDTPL